jgi:hypothetical protein
MNPVQFISDNSYWVMIAAAPFIIAAGVYLLVRMMSEPENMFQSFPGGLDPNKQQTLAGYQSWLNSNDFYPASCFRFGSIHVAAFQQRNTPRFFCFNFHKRLTFCADTWFSDETGLETSNSGDTGMFPRRPGKYAQDFPNVSPDELWRRHLEAETYLLQKFKIEQKSLSMPYEQLLLHNMRLQMRYIRSIPFYPFRALYWFAVTRRRMANRSIQQQFP